MLCVGKYSIKMLCLRIILKYFENNMYFISVFINKSKRYIDKLYEINLKNLQT